MIPPDPAALVAGLAAPAVPFDPAIAAVALPVEFLDGIVRFLRGIERVLDQIIAVVSLIYRIIAKIMWLFGGGG